jgi:alpha-galactosidase
VNLRNVADDLRIRFSTIPMLVAVAAGASTSAGQAEASSAKYDAQSVVFAFLHSSQMGHAFPRIRPRGLDPSATYAIHLLQGNAEVDTPQAASGVYWMNAGVQLVLRGDFQASAFVLERAAEPK